MARPSLLPQGQGSWYRKLEAVTGIAVAVDSLDRGHDLLTHRLQFVDPSR